jgi:hypothetical protein
MPAAGDIIYASDVNRRLATTTAIVDTGTVTTVETVAHSVTASLISGKTYTVRWVTGVLSDVAGDSLFLRIREDSVSGTIKALVRADSRLTGGAGTRWPAIVEAEYTAAATGDKTFVGTYVRATGTGNVKVASAATLPSYLYVELNRD